MPSSHYFSIFVILRFRTRKFSEEPELLNRLKGPHADILSLAGCPYVDRSRIELFK